MSIFVFSAKTKCTLILDVCIFRGPFINRECCEIGRIMVPARVPGLDIPCRITTPITASYVSVRGRIGNAVISRVKQQSLAVTIAFFLAGATHYNIEVL